MENNNGKVSVTVLFEQAMETSKAKAIEVLVENGLLNIAEEMQNGNIETCEGCGEIIVLSSFEVEVESKTLTIEADEKDEDYYETVGTNNGGHGVACGACVDSGEYVQCRVCDYYEQTSYSSYDSYNENHVCDKCYDEEDFTTCEDCGEILYSCDATEVVNHGMVCQGCLDDYYQCDDCCEWFRNYYVNTDDSGHCICDSCYEDDYCRCNDCETIVRTEDAVYSEEDGCWYCDNCAPDHDHSRKLHNYYYKPTPIFHELHDENTKRYFGVELEIDNGDSKGDVIEKINEELPYTYCKHDGSLDDGIEIVSHPCTLAYHMAQREELQTAFDFAVGEGWRSHNTTTCGLHVHVSKDAFGDTTEERDFAIAKAMVLVNNLWNDVVKFTRRKQAQLDRWAQRYCSLDLSDRESLVKSSKGQNSRYCAINLKNSSTVEFRVFRGSMNLDTYMATIQFVNNITEFATTKTLEEVQQANFKDIIEIVKFEELTKYATRRGLYVNTEESESEEV